MLFRSLHVAFRSTELGTQPYLARPIAVDDLVLCASADYLDRHPPLTTPQDLHQHSLITRSQEYGRHERWPLLAQGREIPLEVAGELAFSSKRAIHQAMRQELGIARELLAAGAVSVNGAIRRDEPLTADDRLFGRYLLLRRGKKQYHLVICS